MSNIEQITCKHCFKKSSYILKHIAMDKDCKSAYSEKELQSLRSYSKSITDTNKRIQSKNKYDSEEKAKKYQLKKKEIAENYIKNRAKIAMQNKRKKKQFAEYYQKNKKYIQKSMKMTSSIAFDYHSKKVNLHSEDFEVLTACFERVIQFVTENYYKNILYVAKLKATKRYEKILDEEESTKGEVHNDKNISKAAYDFYQNERYNTQLSSVISKARSYAFNKMCLGKLDENFKDLCQQVLNDMWNENIKQNDNGQYTLIKKEIIKKSVIGYFHTQLSDLIHLEIKKQYEVQLFDYKAELTKKASDLNLSNKRQAKYNLKYQTEQFEKNQPLTEDIKLNIKRIKIGIDVVFEGIEIELSEIQEKANQPDIYFGDIKMMFDDIKVEDTWRENDLFLELPGVPCNCWVCHDNDHKRHWCARIVRQREEKKDMYTCPGCQKPIKKNIFKKHHSVCATEGCKSW